MAFDIPYEYLLVIYSFHGRKEMEIVKFLDD